MVYVNFLRRYFSAVDQERRQLDAKYERERKDETCEWSDATAYLLQSVLWVLHAEDIFALM